MKIELFTAVCLCGTAFIDFAGAHEGHQHESDPSKELPVVKAQQDANATTGQGDLRFRFHPELSELPEEIAKGIVHAHGGFAITPSGEVYFGLDRTGLVRVSADLKTKTLIKSVGPLMEGGLHNTTYLDVEGGVLVLADATRGRLLAVNTEGDTLATLGRPTGEIDPYYADPANGYNPTDMVAAPDGMLYVVDGYSASKNVLAVDVERRDYDRRVGGGPAEKGESPPGKFSTCHGITWDPTDETLTIADRELHRIQKLKPSGEFVAEYGVDGANPCDVEYVDWQGEPLAVVPCLRGKGDTSGVVQLMRGDRIVSTLDLKNDLGIESFEHLHNAIGVVVDGELHVLCYGWYPGCFAVLQRVSD